MDTAGVGSWKLKTLTDICGEGSVRSTGMKPQVHFGSDSNTTQFEANTGTTELGSAAKSVLWRLVLEGKMGSLQGQSHEALLAACVQ